MSSLWKDLLFLHGHMSHASLIWADIDPESDRAEATAKEAKPGTLECCVACSCVAE